jgi:precorrin-2/cobalt-factor-2 C20-methyltransferase
MTLRAHRLISRDEVLAYPSLAGGESFAPSLAAVVVSEEAREIVMDVPMTMAREPAQAAYDKGAAEIAKELVAGLCLCEGAPFFYGAFMFVFARLSERFEVEVVPGVTSITTSAAWAGMPLVARDERLTVLLGPLPEAEFRALTPQSALDFQQGDNRHWSFIVKLYLGCPSKGDGCHDYGIAGRRAGGIGSGA